MSVHQEEAGPHLRIPNYDGPLSAIRDARSLLHVTVRGAVQGVGFRPFVYRLATSMNLYGWVNNSPQGVFIEVEGPRDLLDQFLVQLTSLKPARSIIQSVESEFREPVGYSTFEIKASVEDGARSALIMPDLATCPDCLNDLFDPSNRRYRYPFTNCTNCGPRFSIIESLPYDRPNTTMKRFPMCDDCLAEYNDPMDRRFHAQPNACPRCGPHLELWSPTGELMSSHHSALLAAAAAIRNSAIVAVKGLGGFLLVCDARRANVVALLRERKHRQEKPFALLYPSLAILEEDCHLSDAEAGSLLSPESPIVLLKRNEGSGEIAAQVAPGSPILGVMLPYTPLHYLLMSELGFPVVATSGNLSDEPICVDEHEALERLAGIADLFLVHDRPIARHMDDSIVRIFMDREMVLRRARGYAPLPVRLAEPVEPTLAVGSHLKNSVALAVGRDVFISQHIGDLETVQATDAFKKVVGDLQQLYSVKPTIAACDAHPDYLSTKYAQESGLPVRKVQHHAAHVYACLAENSITGPALGVSWDGTGYGDDGTVWGGEFFRVEGQGSAQQNPWSMKRAAHLRTFRLPGGDKAAVEPRRAAVGVLYELLGDEIVERAGVESDKLPALRSCTRQEVATWASMMKTNVNSPRTSSAGRLFDAVASLLGILHITGFEGQAAMRLEYAAFGLQTVEHYNFEVIGNPRDLDHEPLIIDWAPTVNEILLDIENEIPTSIVAARFHNTMAEMIVAIARRVGEEKVALTGGCFQNALLAERTIIRLREEGFRPFWHRLVPPNDGGIALGQVVAANLGRVSPGHSCQ